MDIKINCTYQLLIDRATLYKLIFSVLRYYFFWLYTCADMCTYTKKNRIKNRVLYSMITLPCIFCVWISILMQGIPITVWWLCFTWRTQPKAHPNGAIRWIMIILDLNEVYSIDWTMIHRNVLFMWIINVIIKLKFAVNMQLHMFVLHACIRRILVIILQTWMETWMM